MSDSKFAPITASLLARKGDAFPSIMGGATVQQLGWANSQNDYLPPVMLRPAPPVAPKASVPKTTVAAKPPAPRDMAELGKLRRISVALTPADHQRLGIASVKKGLSRHEIVREALEHYFEQLSHDMHDECRCMADGTGCQGRCA